MNILAFFAHPDDETMLAGGTLILLAQSGATVHYLCATRGEGGEVGEPPLCTPDFLGIVREREMRCAVEEIGGASVSFLDYVDPKIGQDNELYAYTDDLLTLTGQVRDAIRKTGADAVITHGSNGEYGHPAHRISHQAARRAVESIGEDTPHLYSVSANFEGHPKPRLANQDEQAHLVIDVSSVLDIKASAAGCHLTQNALFVRRASEEAGRKLTVPEVLIRLESLHRILPPLVELDGDSLFEYLYPWSVSNNPGT